MSEPAALTPSPDPYLRFLSSVFYLIRELVRREIQGYE